jgi:hypothetical protein
MSLAIALHAQELVRAASHSLRLLNTDEELRA